MSKQTAFDSSEMDNGLLIIDNSPLSTVILAAGDFPRHPIPLRILYEAKRLFACDGALAELLKNRIEPIAVVGDGDSISPRLKQSYARIYHHIPEQDTNDLTKATLFACAQIDSEIAAGQWPHFYYLGATGKREDHTLGNISLMMHYYHQFHIRPMMITDYGWFEPASGTNTFCSVPGQQVSIFNATCRQLSSTGLKWSLHPFRQFWEGTLNEAVGNTFTIQADGDYMVYRVF